MDALDYKALDFWWNVFQTAILTVMAIYTWVVNRHRVNRESINEIDKRLTTVESDIRNLPSHTNLRRIHENVNGLTRDLAEVKGELKGINRTLHLIDEHFKRGGQ